MTTNKLALIGGMTIDVEEFKEKDCLIYNTLGKPSDQF